MGRQLPTYEEGSETQKAEKAAAPPLYRVLMHNDDYTTMEFVVSILESVFRKSPTDANRIMLNVHMKGVGECGVYPFEIAETKVKQVHKEARREGHPLKCSLEEI